MGELMANDYAKHCIVNGRHIGNYERMYQECDDPWEQTTREAFAPDKAVILDILKREKAARVLDIGCGLGLFSSRIRRETGAKVVALDVSKTAIARARQMYPGVFFLPGHITDYWIAEEFRPDVIVLAEIMWYVLDHIDDFFKFAGKHLPGVGIAATFTTYPPGVQKYGADKFTTLEGAMERFGLNYLDWGTCRAAGKNDRNYFFART